MKILNLKKSTTVAFLCISTFIFSQIRKENMVREKMVSNVETKIAGACDCVTPPTIYYKEYPSTGFVINTSGSIPAYIPSSDLASGKKIHFGFVTGPCKNTVNNPCYGYYKATVNGQSVNSTSVGMGSQTHLEIPINYLVSGSNTITVKGICGAAVCTLASTIVNIGSSPQSSGTMTLAKNCCTVISGPSHTSTFTGQVSFTMAGSVSSAVLEITSASGISYENFLSGDKTGCYSKPVTVKLVNNLTHSPIAGSLINGNPSFSYNPLIDFACMNIIIVKRDYFIKALLHPFVFTEWTLESDLITEDDKGKYQLISTYTNPRTKEIITMKSMVDIAKNGDIYLINIEEAISTLRGITKRIEVVNRANHHYVGHVTLLR